MLVLDRKDGESVIIEHGDDKIEVLLYRDERGKFKLGFDAPPEYIIYRKELDLNEEK